MDIDGVSNARNFISWTFTASSSTTYVVSFYIESVSSVTGVVSYASGTLGTGGTSGNVNAPTTTGRVSYTFTTGTGAGNVDLRFGIGAAGNENGSIRISNVQVEQASFPSSYIPTEGSTVTRAADVLTIGSVTGLDYPLSLAAEFERVVDTGGNESVLVVDVNSSAEMANLYVDSSDVARLLVRQSSSTQANVATSGSTTVGVVYKTAGRISLNDMNAARDGTLGTVDTSANEPNSPTRIVIGSAVWFEPLFGLLRSARIYSGALSDYWLKRITS